MKKNKTIFLKPTSYDITSIKVEAQEFGKLKRVGSKVRIKSNTLAWGNSEFLGMEIGVPIKIKKESLIKSIHFGVMRVSNPNTLLRINIYEFKNGKVGKNIMPENLFIEAKDLLNYALVDLSHLNLVVDQDVLIALETIERKNNEEEFYLAFRVKVRFSGNVYHRAASQSKFQRSRGEKLMKIGAYLNVREVKN